eukprot:m.448473 g.448473  ORF g.448473 m.448473 type:complete len:69 (+) comp19666_c0_seq1:32-238(+)
MSHWVPTPSISIYFTAKLFIVVVTLLNSTTLLFEFVDLGYQCVRNVTRGNFERVRLRCLLGSVLGYVV